MVHILGISGSLRRSSWNTGLLRAAAELLPEGASLEIADLAPLPFYNQDLEADLPAAVVTFREQIKAADALLIASPEYNYSFTGLLKNAIDWASRPMRAAVINGKPAAIIGAGGRFGAVRSQLHLRQVAAAVNMNLLNRPELLVPGHEKFDAEGNLIDQTIREQLRGVVESLVNLTLRSKL